MIGAFISVALGGAFGAVCRYGVNQAAMRFELSPLLATGVVNVVGSFLIGVIVQITADNIAYVKYYPLIATGFLGGLTTFSTFSLETLGLLQSGHFLKAALYAGISVVLALTGVWIGMQVAR